MHPTVKTIHQKNIDRIEELLQQLVIETLAATLSNLIDRNKCLEKGIANKICRNPNCPFSYDIQF